MQSFMEFSIKMWKELHIQTFVTDLWSGGKKNMSPPKGSSHNETGQRSVQLTLYKTKRK